MAKLIIRSNNVMVKDNCPNCGASFRPPAPYTIYELSDPSRPICDQCVSKHDPDLLVMLEDWYKAHEEEYFQTVEA
jgi:hypothetical protein